MKVGSIEFPEVWLVDFEFGPLPDGRPDPICLVEVEFNSGRRLRLWQEELRQLRESPFSVDSGSLYVAYYASAEIGCHLTLSWPVPANLLDLYAEFRNLTNGKPHALRVGITRRPQLLWPEQHRGCRKEKHAATGAARRPIYR
jgi:hypothetical protein